MTASGVPEAQEGNLLGPWTSWTDGREILVRRERKNRERLTSRMADRKYSWVTSRPDINMCSTSCCCQPEWITSSLHHYVDGM